MTMDWDVAAVVAGLAAAYVVYVHVEASRRAWPAWTLRLSGSRRAFVEWLRLSTRSHLDTLAGVLRVARAKHAEGHEAATLRHIQRADEMSAFHARLLGTWLQRWADVTKLLGVSPSPFPMVASEPAEFTPLRRLRCADRVGDALLPTCSVRFRFGVLLQQIALRCVRWGAGAARLRAQRRSGIGPALDDLEMTHGVLVALDDKALSTLEHVLHALPETPPRPK